MATLNRAAAEVMARFDVGAATDVTGFGLLGHLAEMVDGAGNGVCVRAADVPVIPEALEYAAMGLIPAGAYRNRDYREAMVDFAVDVARERRDVLFDPQTSGGLLLAVRPDEAADLVTALKASGVEEAADMGEVLDDGAERIRVV
jgi:selenide,water dikinase